MRIAFLEDADQGRVADTVVAVLKEKDALITEHTQSHVRFKDLNPGTEYAFAKGGYVGVYQHAGETEVELRVRAEAPFPKALFWRTTAGCLVVALLLFALRPPGGLWVTVAALAWALLLGTFLVYLGTWRSSWAVEADLFETLVQRLRGEDAVDGDLERLEDREIARFEEELEAEILALRLKKSRKTAPAVAVGGGASAGSAGGASGEEKALAEKKARLDALRREKARRKGGK